MQANAAKKRLRFLCYKENAYIGVLRAKNEQMSWIILNCIILNCIILYWDLYRPGRLMFRYNALLVLLSYEMPTET